jgi:hypothetical protein
MGRLLRCSSDSATVQVTLYGGSGSAFSNIIKTTIHCCSMRSLIRAKPSAMCTSSTSCKLKLPLRCVGSEFGIEFGPGA